MKLVSVTCPKCGATMNIDKDKQKVSCEYCGTYWLLDDEIQHIHYDNAEEAGYNFEKGRQRKRQEQRETTYIQIKTVKRRRTWLWVLGWIFIFPLPLTILLYRNESLNRTVKILIAITAWIIYAVWIGNGRSSNNETDHQQPNMIVEETTVVEDEIEYDKTEEQERELVKEKAAAETIGSKGIHDESLNGHGWSDTGREEPQYVGIIGYAAAGTNSGLRENDKFAETPWAVPVYEKDKQFYNEIGNIEHKTEVLVLKQELEHEGYGNYSGYLTVEDLRSGEQCILNVSNFITKPYWTYSDPLEAVGIGAFVAEFNQVSDYYPVDKGTGKVELEDGTIVFAIRRTGTYGKNGPDADTNQIEAIVFKQWKYGYGGVSVFFNKDDLKVIY